MHKVGLVLGVFFSLNTFANETVDIEELNRKYKETIQELSKACENLDRDKIPETTAEMFCSNSPFNNITVRYCIYQNLVNSKNDVNLSLQWPTEVQSDGTTIKLEAIYKCSDLKI